MTTQIKVLLDEVTKLDSWDIQSVLGAVNYLVRQTALNTTIRMLPPSPETEDEKTIDYFSTFDAKMKSKEVRKAVSGMVDMANRFTGVLLEYTDAEPSNYETVLEFMTQREPQRVIFEREYNERKRQGMRPQMPMSDFVDSEYAQALRRHENTVVLGEYAVRILNAIDLTKEVAGEDDTGRDNVPDWLYESITQKALDKLAQRWQRAEIRRTNPRIKKADRDIAEGNQHLIEQVIEALGGTKPTFDPKAEDAAGDELDEFIDKVSKIKL